MGWYLRKAVNLGPLRLNFSKHGVGVSAGIKGARLGVNAKGKPYVAGGRYGLYYRENLNTDPNAAPPAEQGAHVSWGAVIVLALIILVVIYLI